MHIQADPPYDVVLVMPVYNEQESITGVVEQWLDVLRREAPNHQLIVFNDGSTDTTAERLEPFAADPRIEIVHQANSGHGATILEGYRRAAARGRWVFQADSDNEIEPTHFARLWARRDDLDLVLGVRRHRRQRFDRWLVSGASRWAVRLFFGRGIRDVNTPFRLIRADVLARVLPLIPPDTFAPNILLAGLCARRGDRVLNIDVPYRGRRAGCTSMGGRRLWLSAGRAFLQTLRVAAAARRR